MSDAPHVTYDARPGDVVITRLRRDRFDQPPYLCRAAGTSRAHPTRAELFLCELGHGVRLLVIRPNGGWLLVMAPDGTLGWVSSASLDRLEAVKDR